MDKKKLIEIFKQSYGDEITEKILTSYREIEENFILKKWKPSELDAGHFVESVRRILEQELFGAHIPYTQNLARFNDQELNRYQNAPGHESFRMLIPRALKSIYNIRNKRGVGHVGPVSPNEMDASYILHSVKWVLAEIVRLKSGLTHKETQELIKQISERNIELIWSNGEVKRILQPKIAAKNQILILLFDHSPQSVENMRRIVEYKNALNFKKIVKKLHTERLIEYDSTSESCSISPTGILVAEQLIIKYGNL